MESTAVWIVLFFAFAALIMLSLAVSGLQERVKKLEQKDHDRKS